MVMWRKVMVMVIWMLDDDVEEGDGDMDGGDAD